MPDRHHQEIAKETLRMAREAIPGRSKRRNPVLNDLHAVAHGVLILAAHARRRALESLGEDAADFFLRSHAALGEHEHGPNDHFGRR